MGPALAGITGSMPAPFEIAVNFAVSVAGIRRHGRWLATSRGCRGIDALDNYLSFIRLAGRQLNVEDDAADIIDNGVLFIGRFEVPVAAVGGHLRRQALRQGPRRREDFSAAGRQRLEADDRLVQTDLAATLEAIARHGPDAFYKGPIAAAVEMASAANGGILTAEDFANYRVTEGPPLICSYRGYRLFSTPPPSSGGTTICEILNILEGYDLGAWPSFGAVGATSGGGNASRLPRPQHLSRRPGLHQKPAGAALVQGLCSRHPRGDRRRQGNAHRGAPTAERESRDDHYSVGFYSCSAARAVRGSSRLSSKRCSTLSTTVCLRRRRSRPRASTTNGCRMRSSTSARACYPTR
jgi:hypothetical protein